MLPEKHERLHAMPHIHIFFVFFYLTKYKKFIEMTLVKKKKKKSQLLKIKMPLPQV